MAEEGKGVGLVILGVVAIVAVVGLVLLLKGGGATGAQIVQPSDVQTCLAYGGVPAGPGTIPGFARHFPPSPQCGQASLTIGDVLCCIP